MLSNVATRQRSIFLVLALALLLVGISPPGSVQANVASVSVSPASWAPGSSPAATFTLNVTGTVTGFVGFWENNRTRTWSLISNPKAHDGTLSGNVLTCATTGVTYTSTLFSGWGDGVKTRVCYNEQDSSYFEIGFNGRGAGIVGPGTIQIGLPAGFLTAPSVIGSTTFQAYATESSVAQTNFTVTVANPAPQPTEEISGMQPLLQQVGMPVTGDCTNVEDSHLAWGTGLSGGWTRSWAGWVNADAGGPVCSRSFVFDVNLQRWSIQ